MRLFPILTAVLVCVALFFVVLQREALFQFAARLTSAEEAPAQAATPDAPASEPVSISAAGGTGAEDAVNVVVLRSRAQDVPNLVRVRGQTEAAREVTVMAETTGTVTSEPIRKGTFVTQGQTLCELSPGSRRATLSEAEARLAEARARVPEARARVPEAEARVAEAQARLAEARLNQTAAVRLSEGGFASETRVAGTDAALSSARAALTAAQTGLETVSAGIESARAGIQAAEAGVERARLDIAKLTIEAPFSGLLETDTAELGALLNTQGGNAACATIVQLDPIKLVGFLPEAQVDSVTVGSPAGARLASGREIGGQVTFLSRAADETTRTFRVEVAVPNTELTIRDGQSVEIGIQTAPIRAHLIPASALTLNDEGLLGLRLVLDGMAAFTPVTLIRDTVEGVLVSGLPDRADIIIVGQEYVTDGVAVRPSYADEQDGEAQAGEVGQ